MKRKAVVPLALENNNIISRVWQKTVTESDRQAELNTYDFCVEIPELRFGVSEIAFGLPVIRGLRVHVDGRTSYHCERRNTAANVSYASPRRVLGARGHRGVVVWPGVVSGGGWRATRRQRRREARACVVMTAEPPDLRDDRSTRKFFWISSKHARCPAAPADSPMCPNQRP